jgi:hypothetical protein
MSALVGIVGLAACAALGWMFPSQFVPGYLTGFLFWVGIAQGCLALTMLHHLVGGGWGLPVRRPLEAGAMTMPLLAFLFVPIVLGLRLAYPWADPSTIAEHQRRYLNPSDFTIRAAIYFAVWTALAWFLVKGSRRQDSTESASPSQWLQAISGPCLVVMFFTSTFAAVDWSMSREPAWASTIYGAMWVVGNGVSAFALMVLVATRLARAGHSEMAEAVTPGRLHDLGNLLLAFVMLWAYMAFSQFLIIWSGNLAEEIPWYVRRTRGGWQWVAITLISFHFIAPFIMLLSRESKRRTASLSVIASLVVAMHGIDVAWLVIPATTDAHAPRIEWASLGGAALSTFAIGAIWLSAFLTILRTAPLVPVHEATTHRAEGASEHA